MIFVVSFYKDHVVLELLGLYLEKANTGNYEDREEIEKRLYTLSREIRFRKIKYMKLVVVNNHEENKTIKKKPDS